MKEEIQELLDSRINPVLSNHMGACELVKISNGVVSVRLTGGCKGCPDKETTLLRGIKPVLLEEVQGVKNVILVE